MVELASMDNFGMGWWKQLTLYERILQVYYFQQLQPCLPHLPPKPTALLTTLLPKPMLNLAFATHLTRSYRPLFFMFLTTRLLIYSSSRSCLAQGIIYAPPTKKVG